MNKRYKMKKAFTMIELVMVIVVLGILSSIAVSKMSATRDDALIVKGKSQVSAIRSAIVLQKSKNMMRGLQNGGNPDRLDAQGFNSGAGAETLRSNPGDYLFNYDTNTSDPAKKILDYPIRAVAADKTGWRKTDAGKYTFRVTNVDVNFTYKKADGSFTCTQGTDTPAKKLCATLSN